MQAHLDGKGLNDDNDLSLPRNLIDYYLIEGIKFN